MFMFIPINFPSVAAIDQWGLKTGVLIGMALTTLGLWLRCLLNMTFYFAAVGQVILAIGQPFIYNAPAKLSMNWFPEHERIFSTSFGAYANIFGVAMGYFIPSIFFDNSDINNPQEARDHGFKMNLYLALFSTFILLPLIFVFRDKPATQAKREA